jgi:hypothetical protein
MKNWSSKGSGHSRRPNRISRRYVRAMLALVLACTWISVFASGATGSPITLFDTGSVSIGTTGQYGGSAVGTSQYVGVRFQATATAYVLELGGHFGGIPEASIFGAIAEISGPTGLPNLSALDTDPAVIGSSVFAVPRASEVVWAPLSAELQSGQWYALIFGGGLFGSTGNAYAPYVDVSENTFVSSFWYSPTNGFLGQVDSTLGYFGIRGAPVSVPEPGTLSLLGAGLLTICVRRRRNSNI